MMTIRYKGFRIVARPYQLSESGRWTADFEIRRSGRGQAFSARERSPSEPEAEAHCSSLGRRIIDGTVPGWSVDRLRSASGDRWAFLRAWESRALQALRKLNARGIRRRAHLRIAGSLERGH
jgi:hypothetical protein